MCLSLSVSVYGSVIVYGKKRYLRFLGKPFGKIMKSVFGLSPCFAPILLLSVTGGYPIGAKSCNELYKNGNAGTEECKRASMFMVCAGPGFSKFYRNVNLQR